ncbi:17481_t:CDS:2 [Gigaspora margarita]|uniref:17481_t:CDS:1 n=1 Tax=Gigaspora margarita TaxID=4874 RepID=A0ABN7UL62_GIGMA|nr:17481_t:CDS:2 [Gigaspora margarita]
MNLLKDTEIDNIIRQHLTTPLKLQGYFQFVALSSKTQVSGSITDNYSHIIIPSTVYPVGEIRNNQIEEEQTVVQYNVPGRPFFLIQNPNLLEYIHESVEYRSANKRRRKEPIKVRIVNHLRHYHFAWVSVTRVSRDETKEHPDEHYCLASVKGARQFAQTFSNVSVIVLQNNKSKIGLDIPAVSRTFHILQSAAQEAIDFLQLFDGFLSPITKVQDSHYINSIHLLQYFDKFKIPGYDAHCPSISQMTYHRLCCLICHKYFLTQAYMAKHKHLLHPSPHERSKKNNLQAQNWL